MRCNFNLRANLAIRFSFFVQPWLFLVQKQNVDVLLAIDFKIGVFLNLGKFFGQCKFDRRRPCEGKCMGVKIVLKKRDEKN